MLELVYYTGTARTYALRPFEIQLDFRENRVFPAEFVSLLALGKVVA